MHETRSVRHDVRAVVSRIRCASSTHAESTKRAPLGDSCHTWLTWREATTPGAHRQSAPTTNAFESALQQQDTTLHVI